MAITRQALRQEIGRLTGDMLKCTATAAGTTTTFIDALRLYKGNGSLTGRIGWLAGGTTANLYEMVRITGNTKTTFTINFDDTALPSNTAEGDVIELWNEKGMGFYPDDVNAEINSALAQVAHKVTSPDEEIISAFDFDDPYLDIPSDWDYFGAVYYEDADDLWLEIPATDAHMDIDPQNRTVRLKGEARQLADTYRVKLIGDVPSSTLSSDTDSTSVNAEWLVAYVSYRLLLPMMKRVSTQDDDVATRMAFVKTVEEKTRGEARNRPQGIGKRLY